MTVKNSQGKIFYGLHFYDGLAEYQEPGKEPYRVYLNEKTIRSMDPTFAGRPVFVRHVDEVSQNIDKLKLEADGWVVKSFYNKADGKHWAEFIVVSEKAENAIKNGWKLSNCYQAKAAIAGGLWNGIEYKKEIIEAEYEHLAIVNDPRYEESIILTPEEFKKYNESHLAQLERVSNNKGDPVLKFFKKTKVENAIDPDMSVVLPKSGLELTLTQIVNNLDEYEIKKKEPQMANGEHMVEMNGMKMTVNEMMDKHMKMCDELAVMKKPMNDEEAGATGESGDQMAEGETPSDISNMEEKEKPLQISEPKDKEVEMEKQKNAADKAKAVVDAPVKSDAGVLKLMAIDLSSDKVARGLARYGSNN